MQYYTADSDVNTFLYKNILLSSRFMDSYYCKIPIRQVPVGNSAEIPRVLNYFTLFY